MELKKGDKIRIIKMDDKNGKDTHARESNGKEGTITHIDDAGQIHGTWGGLALIPGLDEYEKID